MQLQQRDMPKKKAVDFFCDEEDTMTSLILCGMTEIVSTAIFVFCTTGVIYSYMTSVLTPSLSSIDQVTILSIALASGLAYSACLFATINISGAAMNPGMSAALFALRRISLFRALIYIGCQLSGGILGSAFLYSIIPHGIISYPDKPASLYLGVARLDGTLYDIGSGIWVETVFSFFLVLVSILTIATPIDEREENPSLDSPQKHLPVYHTLAPGLVLVALTLVGFRGTMCIGNPARAFGPAAITGDYAAIGVYFAGGFAGAGIASVLYWVMKKNASGDIKKACITARDKASRLMYPFRYGKGTVCVEMDVRPK